MSVSLVCQDKKRNVLCILSPVSPTQQSGALRWSLKAPDTAVNGKCPKQEKEEEENITVKFRIW